ncbi:MAG: hypothetical protein MMC33_010077 [Icmadophila ericetorum]|nr:hypothetical protein [Icmadophila ericetorum]
MSNPAFTYIETAIFQWLSGTPLDVYFLMMMIELHLANESRGRPRLTEAEKNARLFVQEAQRDAMDKAEVQKKAVKAAFKKIQEETKLKAKEERRKCGKEEKAQVVCKENERRDTLRAQVQQEYEETRGILKQRLRDNVDRLDQNAAHAEEDARHEMMLQQQRHQYEEAQRLEQEQLEATAQQHGEAAAH